MQRTIYILFLVEVKYMHEKNILYFIFGLSKIHARKKNLIFSLLL